MPKHENKPFPTWVDGRLHAHDEPALSPFDTGFQLGLAVFDTLLYEDGCRYFEEEHLARLEHGARELGIAYPLPWDPTRALDEYCEAIGARDAALRLTLTLGVPGRGPTLVVFGRVLEQPPEPGVVVLVEPFAKIAGEPLERIKSTNRLRNHLAREKALAAGAWDVVLCTEDGDLSEGTISNVFAVAGGVLHTPGLDRGCLPGIMRGRVLEEAAEAGIETRAERLDPALVARADEVFLTNTTGRITPVVEVRGLRKDLPGGTGPVTGVLRARIRALEERYRAERARRDRA